MMRIMSVPVGKAQMTVLKDTCRQMGGGMNDWNNECESVVHTSHYTYYTFIGNDAHAFGYAIQSTFIEGKVVLLMVGSEVNDLSGYGAIPQMGVLVDSG